MKYIKQAFGSIGVLIFLLFILIAILAFIFIPNNNEYKANIVVECISIAITAGLLTFFINWLPKHRKKRVAKAKIKQNVDWLLEYMEIIISVQLEVSKINKGLKEVTLSDITKTPIIHKGYSSMSEQMKDTSDQQHASDIVPYAVQKYDNTNKDIGVSKYPGKISFIKLVEDKCRSISQCLQDIKKYEYFYLDDIDFVEIITNIENSRFVINTLSDFCKGYFTVGQFGTPYFEFIELYKKLLTAGYNSYYTKTTIITDLVYLKQQEEISEQHALNFKDYFK
ncbi:MAG: hypothetical protein VB048_00505 [Bacteroidaceae bacterium]|nr:hypothetical protein [Bacteroidaceae bacterium]